MSEPFSLAKHHITVSNVIRNPIAAELYEQALVRERGTAITSTGALVALSGAKTGRSPKDKRIVEHAESDKNIWWGPVNIKMTDHIFLTNRERAVDYLNTREQLYVLDGYAGWDPKCSTASKFASFLRPRLPRALHAQHAHPPERGRPERRSASRTSPSTTPVASREPLHER